MTWAVAAALALLCGFFVYFPVTNTDIWWHLAAAREMIAGKSFLYSDPFAYSVENAEWIDMHWLFQLIAYGVSRVAGLRGLVLAKCLTMCGVCLLACSVAPSRTYRVVTAMCLALCTYETRYLILARPVMVTLVCIVAFLLVLEKGTRKGNMWFVLPLAVLQVVWTNSQGLFVLGPVLIGAYLAGEWVQSMIGDRWGRRGDAAAARGVGRRLALALALVVVACVINPYGLKGLFFPFKLLGRIDPSLVNIYSRNVSENIPLWDKGGANVRYFYSFLAVSLTAAVSLLVNWRYLRISHVLALLAFGYLGVSAERNLLLYFVVAVPVVGLNVTSWWQRVRERSVGKSGGGRQVGWVAAAPRVAAVAAVMLLSHHTMIHARIATVIPCTELSPFRVPVAAVQYLEEQPVAGNMFNSIRYGGFLIWRLYPKQKVFVDGRLIIRSPRFFAEYLRVLDNPESFDAFAGKRGITHAVLPIAVFDRYLPLVRWLYESGAWALAFVDGSTVVFVRAEIMGQRGIDLSDPVQRADIRRSIEDRWRSQRRIHAEALNYFENLLSYVGK